MKRKDILNRALAAAKATYDAAKAVAIAYGTIVVLMGEYESEVASAHAIYDASAD